MINYSDSENFIFIFVFVTVICTVLPTRAEKKTFREIPEVFIHAN